MSLLLAESNQLISPSDGLALEPLGLRADVWPLELLFPAARTDPAFVVAAREIGERAPTSPAAAARLAQAELAAGNREAALGAARRAAKLALDSKDAAVGLASVQVLAALGAGNEAGELLLSLPEGPGRSLLAARIALRSNDFERALECLQENDSAESHATRAWIAIERREFRDAIAYLRKALKSAGPNPNLLVNLGFAYAALGLLERAVKVTREARYLDPTSRLVGLNLVTYLRSLGRDDEVESEIRTLQELYPSDMGLVFAEADFRLWQNNPQSALKVLTRARTSELWINAELESRAELEANLAFVRWQLRKLTRVEAFDEVLAQLRRTEYNSLAIAEMLAAVSREPDEADVLDEALSALTDRHPGVVFHRMVVQRHVLRLEFEEATEAAVRWADDEIFNPASAGTAVYLLADVRGDFERAVEIGREALKRNPMAKQLGNNVAYALALAGRLDEARALLPAETHDVYIAATKALVALLSGDIEGGRGGYERARKLAVDRGDEELAALVAYHAFLYQARALKEWHAAEGRRLVLELPQDWMGDPHLVLIARIAIREGVPLSVREAPEAS